MTMRGIEGDVAAHVARNEKLSELILSHGASLVESRSIDFFFYAASLSDAQALGADLDAAGFSQITVGEASQSRWPIAGVYIGSVDQVTQETFVDQLVRLAAKHRAEFDGWGTSI
jgi:hypothetical protein